MIRHEVPALDGTRVWIAPQCPIVAVPADTWLGRVPRYTSRHEERLAGVAAEVDNGQLYERLLARTVRRRGG